MITVNNVAVQFGSRKLFDEVNLKFNKGNCYGVIGANGAGKSTFMKVLSGELEPNKGEVTMPNKERLSVLEQNQEKYNDYTVLRTVLMGHKRLVEIMDEKEVYYQKADFTEEDGVKLGELEAEFMELNGWDAESDAENLLNSLDIPKNLHNELMANVDSKIKVKVLLAQAGFILKAGDKIVLTSKEMETIDASPENIPLDIVYEDDDLLVINKQVGLVVHPCNTTKSHTLVNALMYHIKNLSSINGVLRPGIVHRLDKDTGGLMIVAKNDKAHKILSDQLKDKTLNRQYKALIKGRIKEDFVVEGYLGRNPKNREQMAMVSEQNGRYSKTIFTIDKVYDHYTLLNCKLTTGRTHQIRAHLKSINHPIVGDALYAGVDKNIKTNGQLLFAYKIEFMHPTLNKLMQFEIGLPDYFNNILKSLN